MSKTASSEPNIPVKSRSQVRSEARIKAQQEALQQKRADQFKLIIAVIIAIAGIVGFYSMPLQTALWIKWLLPIAGVTIALAIVFFWCSLGRRLLLYFKNSALELRKVVWPDRNDAWRMTLMVIVFVGLLALFIWGVDSIIAWFFYDVILKK